LPGNQHPYGLGDDVAMLYLHNHHSSPEVWTLASSQGGDRRTVTLTSGDPIVSPSKSTDPHPLRLRRPMVLSGVKDDVSQVPFDVYDVLPLSQDLALKATATTSSGNPAPAIDGSIEGYPGNQAREWVTNGEHAGAWIQLNWPNPTRMTRVLLYDRPNSNDHVVAGTLRFSDGSVLPVGALPKDQTAAEITFPRKTVTWVRLDITKVGDRTENIGLAEIAVTDDR